LFNTKKNIEKLALIEKLSTQIGVTGNQLVLACLLRHDPQIIPIIPIIGFSRKEQYLENIEALKINLTDEYLAMLNI
jgi:aryl-alcohol dehydrogenase-like predicted oxidoreductase